MAWELEDVVIRETPEPRTRDSLAADLRSLGLEPGMTVFVHSSLRSLGWVSGGAVAVIQALMDALTEEGTLVMPGFCIAHSDPAQWQAPPVPASWVQVIRDTMPAFDPRYSPVTGVGSIPEIFRSFPGVLRSHQPCVSFCAWGRHAAELTNMAPLRNELGDESPLGGLYELDGHVLFIGTGYGTCTSFHLAEYHAPGSPPYQRGGPMTIDGQRVWKTYDDIDFNESVFPEIGAAFEATGAVRTGRVGSANCRLFSHRAGVDFATAWLTARRRAD